MSSRSISANVLRLLQSTTAPLCLFDRERRLVFANQACADWVGVPREQLIGQIAAFTSLSAKDGAAVVDRLCPPPDAFAGLPRSGYVYAAAGDKVQRMHADFVPLEASDDGSAVPVMVIGRLSAESGDDQSPAEAFDTNCGADAQSLHDHLVRFHREQCARYRLECIVGESTAIRLARSQAEAAIASRCSVTVVGPQGSGREHLARTIHYAGLEAANKNNGQRPALFLPIDGSLATAESLAEVVTALSSAGRDTAATLLVLHADRVQLELQSEIVRLFVHRFAGVRFLATSDVSPDDPVMQDRMLPVFAAAISTIVIRLPALADRRRDIPLLAQCAVEQWNAERKKQVRGFSSEATDALVGYSWPGNVAELRGFVAEAFAAADGPEITAANLPRRLWPTIEKAGRTSRGHETIVLHEFLTSIERELIERALRIAKGNKAKAARLLGLTRPRLYRRMVQLGLEQAIDVPATITNRRSESRRPRPIRRKPPVLTVPEDSPLAATESNEEEIEFIENIPFEEQPE